MMTITINGRDGNSMFVMVTALLIFDSYRVQRRRRELPAVRVRASSRSSQLGSRERSATSQHVGANGTAKATPDQTTST